MAKRRRVTSRNRRVLAIALLSSLVASVGPMAAASAERAPVRSVNAVEVVTSLGASAAFGRPSDEAAAAVTPAAPFVETVFDEVSGSSFERTASARANVSLAPAPGGTVTTSDDISDFSEGFTLTIEGSAVAHGPDARSGFNLRTSAFNIQEESVPFSVSGSVTITNSANGCAQASFGGIALPSLIEDVCDVSDVVPIAASGVFGVGTQQSFTLGVAVFGSEEPDEVTTSAQADFQITIAVGGAACTVFGTDDAEVLTGTSGPDVLCGFGGNDTISGGGGNDVIAGGPGDDELAGDSGNDTMFGGPGDDELDGGTGSDTLVGGGDDDDIKGGAGKDTIAGCDGRDVVDGGGGGDTVRGAQDAITDDAGAAPSGIDPTEVDCDGTDDGANRLRGGGGADTVTGGPARDTITGDGGRDILNGERGKDTLNAVAGAVDRVNGGPGRDRARTDTDDVSTGVEVFLGG